jgi:N-acetyl-gamma-glutamyl-phosphate reductase
MNKRFGVAIIGGSGYGAGELARLLSQHPQIEVAAMISRSHTGKPISSVHTHLAGVTDLTFSDKLSNQWYKPYESAAVVLAMPAGQAVPAIKDLFANGLPETISIIDLSGDLRLSHPDIHARFYPEVPFAADIRESRVYGLSELNRSQIKSARLISNPGCLATAAIMALAPIDPTKIDGTVTIDAKTGTSGAGREPQASMHHPSRASDFTAYKALEHRHEPEIAQALGARFTGHDAMMFIPHLIPVSRGIFITAYLSLNDQNYAANLDGIYRDFYKGSPFVRFRGSPPRLADVVGTNFCDLRVIARGKQIAVMSAIDNLVKGMAGQCVQNLNIIFDLPEQIGLLSPALGPV